MFNLILKIKDNIHKINIDITDINKPFKYPLLKLCLPTINPEMSIIKAPNIIITSLDVERLNKLNIVKNAGITIIELRKIIKDLIYFANKFTNIT